MNRYACTCSKINNNDENKIYLLVKVLVTGNCELVAQNRVKKRGDTGWATDGSDTDRKLIPLNECATKTRDNWKDERAVRQNQNKQLKT